MRSRCGAAAGEIKHGKIINGQIAFSENALHILLGNGINTSLQLAQDQALQ